LPEKTLVLMHETVELSEQARGYYERLTSPDGIFSPNATFGRLARKTNIEVTQYAARTDLADRVDLPIQQLVPFDQDAKSAIHQLGELATADNNTVNVLCRKQAEADRLAELTQELIPDHADSIRISLGALHRGFTWSQTDELIRSDALDTTQTKTRRLTKARKHKLAAQQSSQTLHLIPHHELFHRYAVGFFCHLQHNWRLFG
ncbi:MAG: hypothetical protein MI745_16915, partial [Pseudomonadales bacterium]|nr:hypothetical protein [Pseudomonadales bacterium]